MSTRNFIRHLEPYGYIDQGKYDKNTCHVDVDVDLSDLYDADKDINDRIDDLCERQSQINNEFNTRISANTRNISALTNALEDITCRVAADEEIVSGYTSKIDTISGDVESLKESASTLFDQDNFISGVVSNILGEIVTKADRSELDSVSSVVDTLSDALEQEIADRESGYSALHDEIVAEKERAISADTALEEMINDERERASSAEEHLEEEIGDLSNRVDEIDGKHDQDIADLRAKDSELDARIDSVASDLAYVSGIVDTKASIESLESLADDVAYVSGIVDSKVSETEFDAYKASASSVVDRIDSNMSDLNASKADKSELAAVSEAVSSVASDLAQEVSDRTSADANLQGEIDALGDRATELELRAAASERDINTLGDRLDQEIQDRIDGDASLVGSPSDDSRMDTINAAKNYASGIVSDASNELKSYSDDKDVALRSAMEEYTDTQVSAKADKSYVNAVKDELNSNIDSSVAEEAAAREGKDSELEGLISSLGSQEQTDVANLASALSHTANVLKAVTEWDNETPDGYEGGGNGILDVLHDEYHAFEGEVERKFNEIDNYTSETSSRLSEFVDDVQYISADKKIYFKNGDTTIATVDTTDFIKDGMVDNVVLNGTNLVITFNTDSGKEDISIPLDSAFNPNNYYDKIEVDSLLSRKTDTTEFASYKASNDAAVASKLPISDFESYSARTKNTIDGKLGKSEFNAYSAATKNAIDAVSSGGSEAVSELETELKGIIGGGFTSANTVADAIAAKQDSSAMTAYTLASATDALSNALTSHTANTVAHVTSADKTNWNGTANALSSHTANTAVHVTAADKNTWNTVTAKTNTSAFTTHTSDTTVHVTAAEKTSWNTVTAKTDTSAFTAHTSNSTVHVTAADKTNWNGKADKTYVDGKLGSAFTGSSSDSVTKVIEDNKSAVSSALNALSGAVTSSSADISSIEQNLNSVSGSVNGISGKLDTLSGNVNTLSGNVNTLSGIVTSHTANTDIHVTTAQTSAWNAKPTTQQMNNAIASATNDMATKTWVGTQLGSYPTNQDMNTAINAATSGKVDTTTFNDKLGTAFTSSSVTEVMNANESATSAALNFLSGAIETSSGDYSALSSNVSTISGNLNTHVSNADAHVSNEDRTKWNGKADASSVTFVSGAVDNVKSNYFAGASYDANAKRINFYNNSSATGSALAYIDATAFIKDGMVDSVQISGGNLVITFNTDSGKEPISIPLTSIFNPSNYYTTAQTSSATAISDALALKQDASGMGAYALTSATNAMNNVLTAHTANTTVHVTSADKTNWNGKANQSDLATLSGKSITTVAATGLTTGITTNSDGTKNLTLQVASVDGSSVILNGYAKGSDGSAVAATDTVNKAIGKLENQIDNSGLSAITVNSVGATIANKAATVTIYGGDITLGSDYDGEDVTASTTSGTVHMMPITSDTVSEAISKLVKEMLDNEEVIASAENVLSGAIHDVTSEVATHTSNTTAHLTNAEHVGLANALNGYTPTTANTMSQLESRIAALESMIANLTNANNTTGN